MPLSTFLQRYIARARHRVVLQDEHYFGEGLESYHQQQDLLAEDFQFAYRQAVSACGSDFMIPQRMRLIGWAATHAATAWPSSCFVELGTGRGFSMSFALSLLKFRLDRTPEVFLFDTFESELPRLAKVRGAQSAGSQYYADSFHGVAERFERFPSIRLIRGELPSSLTSFDRMDISFLHVDLNDGVVEVQCLDKLMNQMLPGSVVILDDFANRGRRDQSHQILEWAGSGGFAVLATPQGQGLLVKAGLL